MGDDKTKPLRSFFPIRIHIGNRRPKKAKEKEPFYPPGWSIPLTPGEESQWRLAGYIAWFLVIGAYVAATLAAAYGAAALIVYIAPFFLQ
ncbi:hypothetical protein AB0V79_23170 [Mesorhizobium ciceri]|uniref:hypothetical protein n=1 Tax=Mesorhizobium ciceri TaxID=39645 RepID=UPI0007A950EE|nr:hypothetical protein [Mesorhizobium ciceri]AMX99652.1 hypothetical protein A4R29_09190 [Mesorhizobium ciceri biovar biserrulae]